MSDGSEVGVSHSSALGTRTPGPEANKCPNVLEENRTCVLSYLNAELKVK